MQEQITIDTARYPAQPGRTDAATDGATTFALTHKVVVKSEPQSTSTESIHALRTLLTARHIQGGCRGIAVCETENAGGAFIATNLAISLAEAGVRTLLVDTRLRDPELERFVQPSRALPGLGDVLEKPDAPIAGALQAIMPNLSLMYAGTARENAQDLLSSQRFATIMDLCLREFDFTIATTAPANRFADARRVASVLKSAIVVARRNVTFVADVHTLVAELTGDQVEVIGTVYNDF